MRKLFLLGFVLMGIAIGCDRDEDAPQLSPEEQLIKDVAEIDAYLEARSITPIKLDTGIRIVFHKEAGTGEFFDADKCFNVFYTGKLLKDDKKFDGGFSTTFESVKGLIAGWQISMPLMQVGDSASFGIYS